MHESNSRLGGRLQRMGLGDMDLSDDYLLFALKQKILILFPKIPQGDLLEIMTEYQTGYLPMPRWLKSEDVETSSSIIKLAHFLVRTHILYQYCNPMEMLGNTSLSELLSRPDMGSAATGIVESIESIVDEWR